MGNENISGVGESIRSRLGTTGKNKVSLALESLLEDAKYYLTTPEGNKALEAAIFPTTGSAKGDLEMMLQDLGLVSAPAQTTSSSPPASSGQMKAHREQVSDRAARAGESTGKAGMSRLQEEYMRRQRLPPEEFLRTLNLAQQAAGGRAGGGGEKSSAAPAKPAAQATSTKPTKATEEVQAGNYQKLMLWLSEGTKKK